MVEKKNYATTQYPEKTDKKLKNARKWAIRGGVFNCIAAFPFALPFVFDNYINLFNDINSFLGFGGKLWISPSEGANMLFLNTAGLALFLVGLTLLYASKNIVERAELPLFNGIIRFVWGFIAIYYIVSYEMIQIMFIIVIIDFIFASMYFYYYYQIYNIRFLKNKVAI